MAGYEIRPMDQKDIPEIAKLMARSFAGDPLYAYLTDDEALRQKFLLQFFSFRLKYAIKRGKVFVTSDKKAVAAWIPPGTSMSPIHLLLYGGIKPILMLGKDSRQRMMDFTKKMIQLEKDAGIGPHWELSPIAVDPGSWGKGYAKALMNHMLSYFDQEGELCFLLTQSEKNRDIYFKYGFTMLKELDQPGAGFRHYAMVRKPQKA